MHNDTSNFTIFLFQFCILTMISDHGQEQTWRWFAPCPDRDESTQITSSPIHLSTLWATRNTSENISSPGVLLGRGTIWLYCRQRQTRRARGATIFQGDMWCCRLYAFKGIWGMISIRITLLETFYGRDTVIDVTFMIKSLIHYKAYTLHSSFT